MPGCSPEDTLRSLTKYRPVTCLSTGDLIGITVTCIFGLLSLVAILYVVVKIARNIHGRLQNANLEIFRQPMDILVASLFLSDTLQAIGIVQSLRWVQNGKVETGSFCNAQGIIKIFGATGVALSTLAIGVFTFIGIWVDVEPSMPVTYGLVACIWSFIGILVAVAMSVNRNKEVSFMGPTPFWCWVDVGLEWKMVLEYMWLWLVLFILFLIYIPLFLWRRGNIILPPAQNRGWSNFQFNFVRNANPGANHALVMLLYPMVYCLCILPLSAVRWTSFVQTGRSVPPAATFAVVSIFALSGFLNVALLLKTRPLIPLFNDWVHRPATPPANEPIPLAAVPPAPVAAP